MAVVTIIAKDAMGRSLEMKVSSDHCERLFKLQTERNLPTEKRWKLKKTKNQNKRVVDEYLNRSASQEVD